MEKRDKDYEEVVLRGSKKRKNIFNISNRFTTLRPQVGVRSLRLSSRWARFVVALTCEQVVHSMKTQEVNL